MCSGLPSIKSLIRLVALLSLVLASLTAVASASPLLQSFLQKTPASQLVATADSYGKVRDDIPVAPIMKSGQRIGWAWLTSDFVGTTGYSGKPIHTLVAIDDNAKILGAELVEHSEPIVLVGIPNEKIIKLTQSFVGVDLVKEAASGGESHDLDIISGATVTIIVIDDSIIRSGLKVARALGLGGLKKTVQAQRFEIDPQATAEADWGDLTGDGTVRRLSLDVAQVNQAFEQSGDERAIKRPEKGPDTDRFIDMVAAPVSIPAIGKALLGKNDYASMQKWLKPGEHAFLIAGRGRYSFKGSGYVRGGIFDRIQLVQGDNSFRFRDKVHKRVGVIGAQGAPSFTEMDLFKIKAGSEFDPTQPWRLQLLVQRRVGAIDKSFVTFDLGYRLPKHFTKPVAVPAATDSHPAIAQADQSEQQAKQALWKRVWLQKRVEIAGVLLMLGVLTLAFFFQNYLARSARVTYWFRVAFLSATLVFLGWYANAQLSVVNLMALAGSLTTGFTWDAFLMEPLTFILWFSVAAALIFWGRGAYCGWLCPFGALQELLNKTARFFKVPQWQLPFGLHERLWALKYIIFLVLFGISLVSMPWAERLAEVEPFKTAIILKFDRSWPFVLFALLVLAPGLFIDRFYCRYLCPLGGALAIPARMRMFDWLKRYPECGRPCQTCGNECPVQAIHPTGEINPNECVNCMHCQVLYNCDKKCPVVIKRMKRRAHLAASAKPDTSRKTTVTS
ncbi:NosR/NirI family protein [Polycladidibacter hongkongensis]|uniref:NosR/NirI family protein n=1 Tax=Polycladidibacter hongkongensis TaxID=1647556 RepID=UPI0008323D3D|nr:NosR/NirI family protein [Pseudovibrio hongkongensis]